MSVQVLLVVGVHRHRGKRAVIFEVLFVMTGVKPFVDTWRILNCTVNVGAQFDSNQERIGCEMVDRVRVRAYRAHPDARPPRGNEARLCHGLLDRHVLPLERDHHDEHVLRPRQRCEQTLAHADVLRRRAELHHTQATREGTLRWHDAMSSSGAFVQVSLSIFLLAHVIGKLTTIPLLLNEPCRARSLSSWRHYVVRALQARPSRFPSLGSDRWSWRAVGLSSGSQAVC
jgi:hypothetical protein